MIDTEDNSSPKSMKSPTEGNNTTPITKPVTPITPKEFYSTTPPSVKKSESKKDQKSDTKKDQKSESKKDQKS